MAGLIESYKKVFENKKVHVWLFLIAFVWALLSNLFDIAIGKPDSFRQNIFDIIFNFLVGIYSIQFLHDAIHADGSLPEFNMINWKALPGLIGLNIVWGFYMAVPLIAAVLCYMLVLHSIVLSVILLALIALISVFVYYIYLAYAEDFQLKGLMDVRLVFKFFKACAKETYIKSALFLLLSAAVVVIYLMFYVLCAFAGIDKAVHIAGDYYLFDIIMFTVIGYFLIVTWFFAFPYSLVRTYVEKVRPIIRKEQVND